MIEVEVRLGTITSQSLQTRFASAVHGDAAILLSDEKMRELDAKFVAGVKSTFFEHCSKTSLRMAEGDRFAKQAQKQIVYSFAGSKRAIEEIDVDTGMKQPPYMQVKERLGCINIFLPHCPYDVRVAVSCEFPNQDLPNGIVDLPSPESEREKDRTSIVGRELRIDLTQVIDRNEKLYEVEVELKPNAVQDWLTMGDDAQAFKIASEHSAQLWNIVKYFMPGAGHAFKRRWGFDGAAEIQQAYRNLVPRKDSFPGTMPVGFARWHIPHIKSRKYWVAEKTDGVRYFLVVAGGTAALVDRTNSAFTCSGLDLLSTVFPAGTVLDGEYVWHQKEGKNIFMAFDILATGTFPSENHVQKPFEERLRILNEFLSEEGPFSRAIRGHVQKSSVLNVMRKRWVPATHITAVFKQITKVKKRDGSIARIYSDDKRDHFTDGIVFCPNTPYICGSHNEYLKWKWSDLITIDFEATLEEESKVSVTCGGPRNNPIELDSLITIDPKDKPVIGSLLSKLSSQRAILEFGFTSETGLWNYKCHRPDKDRANYIRTVLGSLLNIAEAISEEELQYRIISDGPDDWNEQAKRMRRGLLHHRLKQ